MHTGSPIADKVIRVLIADDHALLRDGIAVLLSQCNDLQVIGQAETGSEAIAAYRRLCPDVLLLDLQLPDMDGLDVIAAIRNEDPPPCIVVLTTYSGDARAQRALRAGARGYTLKNHVRRQLPDTIRRVYRGIKVIDPDVAGQIAEHLGESELTTRELQILSRIAEGEANKRIAALLGISEDTVKGHVSSILTKLNARDRTHAVTTAIRRGLLQI